MAPFAAIPERDSEEQNEFGLIAFLAKSERRMANGGL
jgi:hypothetical protein